MEIHFTATDEPRRGNVGDYPRLLIRIDNRRISRTQADSTDSRYIVVLIADASLSTRPRNRDPSSA